MNNSGQVLTDPHARDTLQVGAHPGEIVSYRVHVTTPQCFDDGDYIHDQWVAVETYVRNAQDDADAVRQAYTEFEGKAEHCRHGRHSWVQKVERVVHCIDRIETVSLRG